MIYFVTGKPRQGKSYWCVTELVRHLVQTDVTVVTNISLKLPELHEYIVKHYPNVDVDVFKRVRMIESKEVFEFWRYRAGGYTLPHFEKRKESAQDFLLRAEEYFKPIEADPETAKGVAYFLDEIHLYFSSHRWQEIGDFVDFYSSLHGHLCDSVYMISNRPSLVYKGFRELVNEWYFVQNNYERSFGPFRRRAGFERLGFENQPNGRTQPVDREIFKLDDIGDCYNTRSAAGVRTVGTEVKRRGKFKFPFWTVPVGILAVGVIVVLVLWQIPGVVGGYFNKFTEEVESPGESVARKVSGGGLLSSGQSDPGEGANPVYPDQRIWVTGIIRLGSRVRVLLSDGTVLDNTDRKLGMIAPNGVWIDGVKYPLKPGVVPNSGGAIPPPPSTGEVFIPAEEVPPPSGPSDRITAQWPFQPIEYPPSQFTRRN